MVDVWQRIETARAALTTLDGARAWIALPAQRREALLAADGGVEWPSIFRLLGERAERLARAGEFSDALTIFDELMALPHDNVWFLWQDALWAVRDANHHRGVMPERARAYLDACFSRGAGSQANPRALAHDGFFHEAIHTRLELGDVDGAIEAATHLDCYGMQRIRDDLALLPLWKHSRWRELFAEVGAPTFPNMAEELAMPELVYRLQLDTNASLPTEISAFTNLETLAIRSSLISGLPAWLAGLTRLKVIRVTGTRRPLDVPDEVLAMPSLRTLVFSGRTVRGDVCLAMINALLDGFAKTNPSAETRLLHIALFRGDIETARSRGDLRMLFAALDSPTPVVRLHAKTLLAQELGRDRISIDADSQILVMGKTNTPRAELADRLAEHGAKLVRVRGPKTTAVIIGDRPGEKVLDHLDSDVTVGLESDLLAALAAKTPGLFDSPSLPDDLSARLGELLASDDSANRSIAITIMKRSGVPPHVFEELLLVMQNSAVDKQIRAEAKALFAQHAPRELQDAVLQRLAKTSLFAMGDRKLSNVITALATLSNGAIDPTKLATLLLPGGFEYLVNADIPDELMSRVLRHRLRDEVGGRSLVLSSMNMTRLPSAIAQLQGITTLTVSHNRLTTFPDVTFDMADLTGLSLANNRLTSISDSVERLTNLRLLDISRNGLREFPPAVVRMTGLRTLRVSAAPEGSLVRRFTALPENLGSMVELEELALQGHRLATLPESMRHLTRLTELNLNYNDALVELPEWLPDLPALKKLELYGMEITHGRDNPVVVRLRERGVDVKLSNR